MAKVIIQIPCYNEEKTLATTLADLPRTLPGVTRVEWLVIDDGSTDRTVEVAYQCGVDHLVRFPKNQGLARAFMAGLAECIHLGADVIVNTDADNQYSASDIPRLVEPILSGEAEIVIGARPISDIQHFSRTKKVLQRIGSWAVRVASKTSIPDAPSGFRAISRRAAMQLNVFSKYTYTLETIIQAGQRNMAITSVPISTNEDLRPSRLVKSIGTYVWRSVITICRVFITYRPLRFFSTLGLVVSLVGVVIGLRFLVLFFMGNGDGHVQSLILAALFVGIGCLLFTIGLLSDLIAVNRQILEENRARLIEIHWRMTEMSPEGLAGGPPDHRE